MSDHGRTAIGERRIFIDVHDARQLILDLADGPGVFVHTRLPFALGDEFLLAARLPRVTRPLELPVSVLGRRAPKGASGMLSAGVVVRLTRRDDPTAKRLVELANGSVVDFETRVREHLRIAAAAELGTRDEVLAELRCLARNEPAQFPTDVVVQPGDRLDLAVSIAGTGRRALLAVEVCGTILRDGERAVRVRVFDDEGMRAVRNAMNTFDRAISGSRRA
jgi:Tfp pilus assembly protein PilZ